MNPVWGGHSCPPPLKLTLPFSALSFVKGSQARNEQSLGSVRRDASTAEQADHERKIQRQSGGQECPPHTNVVLDSLAGPLAQRLEQWTHNPLVPGSNPGGPTNSTAHSPARPRQTIPRRCRSARTAVYPIRM